MALNFEENVSTRTFWVEKSMVNHRANFSFSEFSTIYFLKIQMVEKNAKVEAMVEGFFNLFSENGLKLWLWDIVDRIPQTDTLCLRNH